MFKLVLALTLFFAAANAGLLGAPVAYSSPLLAAPVAHVAPVVKAAVPVATSYQNLVQISQAAVPVVAAAPVIKAAPLAYASPLLKAAPLLAAPSSVLAYGHHY